MLTSIQIENFRCFDQIKVDGLSQVNLIAGKNNVGKTALLEGISLLASGNSPEALVHLSGLRSSTNKVNQSVVHEFLLSSVFKNFDTSQAVKIEGNTFQKRYLLRIQRSSSEIQVIDLPDTNPEMLLDAAISQNNHQGISLMYLSSDDDESHEFITEINIKPSGQLLTTTKKISSLPFKVFFIPSVLRLGDKQRTEMFSSLQIAGHDKTLDLIQCLKLIEPALSNLQTVAIGGIPMLYGDIGISRLLPLSVMGEGLNRLVSILLAIGTNPGGIVLIDEIENGLHHSVLSNVWKVINDAAHQFNVQVIATTHSYECIQSASGVFLKNSSDSAFRLHRLDRIKDKVQSITYDDEALEGAMQGYLEVR